MTLSLAKPNVGSDQDTWGIELNTALDAIVSAHNALDTATAKVANLAGDAAGGIATVALDGTGQQPPQAHTHAITVQDSGGTTYYTADHLDIYAGSGNVQFDAINNKIKLLMAPPDVRTLYLTNDVVNATNVMSASVANLQLDLPNTTDSFDIDGTLYFKSSAAALIKIQTQVSGTGPTMFGHIRGPVNTGNTATSDSQDAVTFRTAIITSPTNGPQQFGMFPAGAGVLGRSYCEFKFRVAAGSNAASFTVKFSQVTNTPADATTLLAGSNIYVNRVS